MPSWTERHVPDLGIMLTELLAYEGDRLSYQQDAVATEAYLDTARLRVSVRRHARLVDYPMHDGCSARAWVCIEAAEQVTLPKGTFRFSTADLEARGPAEVFEPVHDEPVELIPARNRISLWTWGDHDCCLPIGATSATLVDSDRALGLEPGDVLLFEELVGVKSGLLADADHTHRQAVRLISVAETTDELYRQKLLEVTWAREDALTFPLCVNARGGPDCVDLEVGVARGTWCWSSTASGSTRRTTVFPTPRRRNRSVRATAAAVVARPNPNPLIRRCQWLCGRGCGTSRSRRAFRSPIPPTSPRRKRAGWEGCPAGSVLG